METRILFEFLMIGILCTNLARAAELLFISNGPHDNTRPRSDGEIVQELAKRLEEVQIKSPRPYRFPVWWQQDKGMYPSEIKINLAGKPQLAELRDLGSVFDNNMFATAWITICVLEAHYYAKAPRPTDAQLSLALEAIAQYHDKNLGYNNSVMNFWPQMYNESSKMWESTPTNLLRAFDLFDSPTLTKLLEEILKLIGLSDIEHMLESILSLRSTFERAFHIPADFDDTFVNLGLGALLKDLSRDLPDAFAHWANHNTNVTSVVDALRRYAYRPFSSDQNVNTIDVRTFYYMRHFLGEAVARKEDIALVPTWAQNLDEARKDYNRGVAMPFQMNNVDVTVAANTVYGITASVLSGVLPSSVLDDPLIRQVYLNTSSMIASQIDHHLYERPDLELTYYPSVFEFYWFVARTYARLETALQTAPLPDVMQDVYNTLKPALEQSMTSDVRKKAKAEGQDMLYFDDFLGDGDVDDHNRTVIRGEDRLFTTSMAINALLSTWTVFNDINRTTAWKQNTPAEVRTTVTKAVKFVNTYILEDTYKPWNVFFSGSSKGSSAQNLDEARKDYYRGVAMPFQMNNVDVTVAANTVYGITASVLSGVLPCSVLDDPLIRQVYLNTSSMIASQISHRLYERPDLELTYYPSAFQFYWFVARTYARLETALQTAPLPNVMQDVYNTLKPALEQSMTSDVRKKAKAEGQDMLYFDDFLGDGDVDDHNRTVIRGEDRLFTTSMAINALLSTWTVFNDVNRTITWKQNTPAEVRTTVTKAVKFLNTYILEDNYKPWNVFFSGSFKGSSSRPFSYPANRIEFLNGTVIHDDQHFPDRPFLFGVRGFIPESQYSVLINEKHFGMSTPTKFTSYNEPGGFFPFWSSSPYTYANAILAQARYDNIIL